MQSVTLFTSLTGSRIFFNQQKYWKFKAEVISEKIEPKEKDSTLGGKRKHFFTWSIYLVYKKKKIVGQKGKGNVIKELDFV